MREKSCKDCGTTIAAVTCRTRCAACQTLAQRQQKRAQYQKHKDHWPKAKESYQQNPGKFREYHYKHRYGLTRADVDAMHVAQGGVCAVCAKPVPLDGPSRAGIAVVDHCHATGKVRGLLCRNCNVMLGTASDQPDVLRAAIAYLERSA